MKLSSIEEAIHRANKDLEGLQSSPNVTIASIMETMSRIRANGDTLQILDHMDILRAQDQVSDVFAETDFRPDTKAVIRSLIRNMKCTIRMLIANHEGCNYIHDRINIPGFSVDIGENFVGEPYFQFKFLCVKLYDTNI